MRTNGFTQKGIEWYRDRLAELILEQKTPLEAYEIVSAESGMAVQSFRQRISVKEMRSRALEIAGTTSLEDYFQNQTSIELNQEEAA